jgi:hypothetical protein
MMVKQIAKISWKGVAMVIGFVVIVMSTPSALDLGSGVSTLGLGLAALDLDSISRRPL